ncbi:hypothetical protein [Brassicibacter mesophilus]|uniref:hypothetical protein n=1 Tax=Brassicibacter mesophilus TaxID=745119 RepID=UPI003D229F6F
MKFKNREEIKNILEMNITDKEKKNLIANLKNIKTDIGRIICTNYELDIKEGQAWNNKGVATSWTDRNDDNSEFKPEASRDIKYLLHVENEVAGYKVQYFNYDDLEELGLEEDEIDELLEDEVYNQTMSLLGSDADMKNEAEILVPAETKFKIKEISDAREDEGYIYILLEEIK